MKQIILKRLTLAGFKSFRQRTGIDLPVLPGMVMVAGDNRVEPRMGGNGAGKSTLWDALTFCLTGASVRGARGSDLITHGEKRCSVSAEFEIDGIPVTLSREGPPFHPRIDGEQAEQADVDRMFGLSRLRFLNSVVFGQAVPLFIDLPVPQRGELLDEVLDLQLWMRAAVHAGNRWATTQRELDKLLVEVARTEGALGALEDAAELRARVEEWGRGPRGTQAYPVRLGGHDRDRVEGLAEVPGHDRVCKAPRRARTAQGTPGGSGGRIQPTVGACRGRPGDRALGY